MKLKRIALIILIVFVSAFVLAFIFISPIVKYEVQKNSEQWIGRKVTMDGLWINLLNGSVKIKGLKVCENKSEKVFFSCGRFYIHVTLRKLLSSEYEIKQIKITRPEITITQKGSHFNYDDLIKRFADTTAVKKKPDEKPAKFWVYDFAIDSAIINYSNNKPETNVSMQNFNVSCAKLAYNEPAVELRTSFDLKSGGSMDALINLNSASYDYRLKMDVKKFNIAFMYPYLHDYMKVKTLDGLVSSSIVLTGNFKRPADVATSGSFEVEKFSIVDTTGEMLTSVESFKMGIDSVNTTSNIYRFSTISVTQPYLAFAMYKDGYNFQRIMTEMATTGAPANATAEEYSNIFQLMMGYVKEITEQYEVSSYSVEKFKIDNGHMLFTDYTLEDKFQYDMDAVDIESGNLSSKNERIDITASSRLNGSGDLNGTMSVNPNGFRDMDVNYTVKGLRISDMNPYSKYYVATPFMDGVVLYESSTTIKDNKMKSSNNITVTKIEVGKKVKNKTAYNLPIKLAVSLLKDVNGNVKLDIPVEGDLNDPKYKLGKVIWDVIKNLIVKAATAPFRMLANAFGGKEEDYKEIQFAYLQSGVGEDQKRAVNSIAKALEQKPDLKVELVQVDNRQEEMEQLALLETKKQYLSIPETDSITSEQASRLQSLSNMDSTFSSWVDQKLNTVATLNSIQNRCIQYIGKEKLAQSVNTLMESRNAALANYFAEKKIALERIKISNAKDDAQTATESDLKYVINFSADDSQNTQASDQQQGHANEK